MICKACDKKNIKFSMSFDKHPISHHFNETQKNLNEKFINIKFYQCQSCGLLQLAKTFKSDYLKPKYSFIKQNEPEDHLDRVVKNITQLPGVNKNMRIVGLSYKDQTVLNRFKKMGFKMTKVINFSENNKEKKNPDFEILDGFINSRNLSKFATRYGKVDLVISRHFFEHTHSIKDFMQGVKTLLKKSKLGYFFLEVPDCERSLKAFEYPMIWEQHKVYFTRNTLEGTLDIFNFKKIFSNIAKYKYEDCLLYVGKMKKNEKQIPLAIKKNILKKEVSIANNYFLKLQIFKKKIFNLFKNLKTKNKKIAFYGSGHNGVVFINLFKIKQFIDLVLDDNYHFHNLFLPGSNLIISNPQNINKKIDYCFLSANFDNEKKIIKKNNNLLSKNGKFISISFHNTKGITKYLDNRI